MEKIIKGVKYNTGTAKLLTGVETATLTSEFLYQKTNGMYFLLRRTVDGEVIVPFPWGSIGLNHDHAKKWAEENLTVRAYEKIFGEVSE